MIRRQIEQKASQLLEKYPILAIVGPRQSGKTTLAKALRPHYRYVNMELEENRLFAENDPHGFLQNYQNGVILDEIQAVPSLFPYIKHYTDERGRVAEYIITGSQHFLLLEKITQSLAGRVSILQLLPFSYSELKNASITFEKAENFIFKGGYPRIYDQNIDPIDFYPSYISTYIERDVRQIINILDLRLFRQFLATCAGRVGQVVNFTDIGGILGIDAKTVKSWLGLLEASFILFLLPSYHRNFDKRVSKSPKLYFYDTGLACSLLNIRNDEQLENHFAKGALFENMVVVDMLKQSLHNAQNPAFYFWKDTNQREIDIVIEEANQLKAVEIKAGKTINHSFFKHLSVFQTMLSTEKVLLYLVYGGDESQKRTETTVVSWRETHEILDF